ncbi:DNA polymerase delta subunit 4 [Rhynchospora pubera]|uniref:DNA polymerase delta subunit 4 n=1 Tax=Rhynchospora pubera TaxID=906938 RepID=A0AAV8EG65_9POAL|nr:DNA polymerase delta subunit 4 [Rhynchospora pubera]
MSSGDIKGFYRQKKKNGGVTKPSSSSSSSKKSKSKHYTGGASVGAPNAAQTPALVTRGGAIDLKEEYGDEEEALRQFDMDMKYGPCIGVGRLERWERAAAMGLHPPLHVREVLVGLASGSMACSSKFKCLWEGLV